MIEIPLGISPIALVSTLSGGLLLLPLIIWRKRKLNKFLKKWFVEMIKELLNYEPSKEETKKFMKYIKKELEIATIIKITVITIAFFELVSFLFLDFSFLLIET